MGDPHVHLRPKTLDSIDGTASDRACLELGATYDQGVVMRTREAGRGLPQQHAPHNAVIHTEAQGSVIPWAEQREQDVEYDITPARGGTRTHERCCAWTTCQ